MKTIKLGTSTLEVPVIAVGCMRLPELDAAQTAAYLDTCMELGLNFFDHADIYSGGICETQFAKAAAACSISRDAVILQSKCGIVPGKMYDFSKSYIINAVEGSLKRLNTDYLDVLVLHRPDALMEPEEVAEAFELLKSSGKVRHFGVSNHKPSQIELLKKYLKQDLLVNQLQFSISVSNIIASGMEVNMTSSGSLDHDGSVLDYCRLHDMTIQAWSPFQLPDWQGTFIDSPQAPELNQVLDEIAADYGVSKTTIASAWILRHPANMQLIAGTMNLARMQDIVKAADITLTREEWYRLYLAAGHILP